MSQHAGSIVVYSPIGAPLSYLGRLVEFNPESGLLVLQAGLILRRQEGGMVEFLKFPHASRESLVYLSTRDVPGTLVVNPEDETVKRYEDHALKAYSRLAIL